MGDILRLFRRSKPIIEELERKENVKELIKALEYNEADVRKEAAAALGRIGDVQAVEPLIQVLKDSNEEVRLNAAAALIKLES